MLKNIILIICSSLLILSCDNNKNSTTSTETTTSNSHYPVTVTSFDYNRKPIRVTYNKEPEKIVSTNHSTTELLLELGLGKKMVGTSYLDNPIHPKLKEMYDKIPVLSAEYPSKEAVLATGADFIIGWQSVFAPSTLGDVYYWHNMGINTMIARNSNNVLPPISVENFIEDVRDLGKIFDIEDTTNKYIQDIKVRLDNIKNSIGEIKSPIRVLVLEQNDDGTYYISGSDRLVGDMVAKAGGVNIADKSFYTGNEAIINLNPDVIFLVTHEDIDDQDNAKKVIERFKNVKALSNVNAVKNNRFLVTGLVEFVGGNGRTIPAIERYAAYLYPEKNIIKQ